MRRYIPAIFILIAVIVIAIALSACGDNGPHTLSQDELSRANLGASQWAQSAGETFLSCNGTDSPPVDDHTSCTLKPKEGRPYVIQCSYKSTGCKPGK